MKCPASTFLVYHLFLTLLWFTTLISTTHTSAGLGLDDLGSSHQHHHHHHAAGQGRQEKVDLLEAVGLFGNIGNFSVRHQGVVLRPGPHSAAPAAFFTSSLPEVEVEATGSSHRGHGGQNIPRQRKLKVNFKSDHLLWSALSRSELALVASIRQWEGNSGTLLSLSSGSQRLFEIQSSGRTKQLRVIYRALSSSSSNDENYLSDTLMSIQAVETLSVNLADNQWHKLAVTLSGNQLQVFLDCQSILRRIIRPLDFRISQFQESNEELSLWIGQQSEQRFLYKGYIQNFFVVSGQNGHGFQCPTVDLDCPTCGEFRNLQNSVQALQDQYLREIQQLRQRLEATEDRLSKVEECDCHKSCPMPDGIVHKDGASWSSDQCQLCSCVRGVVTCRPPSCPTLNCTDPNPPDPSRGICCPSCKAECRDLGGQIHPHGARFSPKACVQCHCDNGHINCTRQDPIRNCPKLSCPPQNQILAEGQCCKTCQADFCSRGPRDCHPELAVCVNGLQNYTCHCKQGFKGDGKYCEDINECEQLGDHNGHFCTQSNSICVNTFGSYKCDCAQGYYKSSQDEISAVFQCNPINECLNASTCHPNATCHYSGPGSHQCQCQEGFTGNGTHCSPICEAGCENGGQCVGPNQCACPYGFQGPLCQDDIDECSMEPSVHKCSSDSTCVNKPGWHYCECKPGFKAYQDPALDGQTICIDENECDLGTHTCHPTAQCWNTAGSFQCYCGYNNDQICSTECMVKGVSHPDGSQWYDGCKECRCQNGVASCDTVQHSCSNCSTISNIDCCPQQCHTTTNTNNRNHKPSKCQLFDDIGMTIKEYHNGQKWLEQCQECECLNGEIDCWPMECPPTFCSAPILRPGHCCPSCDNKSSGLQPLRSSCHNSDGADASSSCLHLGTEYKSGQSWAPLIAPPSASNYNCTKCNCRVPYCDERVSRAASSTADRNFAVDSAATSKNSCFFCTDHRMAMFFVLIHVLKKTTTQP